MVANNALTPNAIAKQFNTTRQAISKHIKILNECEYTGRKKMGREIYYQLKIDKMKEVDQWLEQFKKIWKKSSKWASKKVSLSQWNVQTKFLLRNKKVTIL